MKTFMGRCVHGLKGGCSACEESEKDRIILPGSCWRRKADGMLVLVDGRRPDRVYYRCQLGLGNGTSESDFRAAFEWVADPGEKS